MAAQRPRFHATIAQITRELGRESMQGQDTLRLNQFHVAQEIGVIRVIRKRKGRIDLIAIDRVRIDRPTTDHRDAFVWNFLEHLGTVRARRTNQHLARDRIRLVALVFAKRLAELLVDPRHLMDGAVQHRFQSGAGERAKNLLRFA